MAEDLIPFSANIWLASPACQPYSVVGSQKGELDPRAQSFLHLMKNVLAVMVECDTQPEYLLVENVAGFEVLSDHGFKCLCSSPSGVNDAIHYP
jgi:tRNA (cytosine38-C5)-methyltransferase